MKCANCGHVMELGLRSLATEVKGEQFQIQVTAMHCAKCDRVLLTGKSRRAYHRAGSDAYRRAHRLLTGDDLAKLRKNLGMNLKQFAAFVGVSIATLKRWLGGEIQTESMDLLVRLKADPGFAQRALEELLTRLATDGAELPAVEMVAQPRRNQARSVSYESETVAADSQYPLAA